ncbi:MAG: hypothetical protein A4E66_02277 [Syntrophus sp. PtaB.Bin001]|nr:MAG: hypothetical protein A4E66_02277 [Syntrophus sp. PtaB.Bin001]
MKILYYDCFSGISGDMNLGALLDLGVDQSYLLREIKKLKLEDYEIGIARENRKGIYGTSFKVMLPPAAYTHQHRNYSDIVRLIAESDISERVKKTSLNIFLKIAEAEALVHGCDVEEVHFHEVGAVDSIVDIVGAAVCLDFLKVDRVLSSPVELGGGMVRCAHGILPVPAPATAEILKGIPVKSGAVPFETTTPTGAAILAATVAQFTERVHFTTRKIGYGIGRRDMDIPNILRIFMGDIVDEEHDEDVTEQDAWLLECNIDDMNPELYDAVMDALYEKGALDVYLTPIMMKKSRPAVTLSIICDQDKKKDMEEILWLETTTFGLRSHQVSKAMLRREFSKVETKYGPVSIKHAYFKGRRIKSKPEYEDCKKLAGLNGVSIKEIMDLLP